MKISHSPLFIMFTSLLGASQAAEPPPPTKHLAAIMAQINHPATGPTLSLTLGATSSIPQKPNTSFPTGLPPIRHTDMLKETTKVGYLMWDDDEAAELAEFTIDLPLQWQPTVTTITNVPPQQQFPLPAPPHGTIASGCVPTAAGSVLAFWAQSTFPAWKGELTADLPKGLTLRIRSRLSMTAFPDNDGFTPDGMSLAGAMPKDLAKAINADAKAHRVPMTAKYQPFAANTVLSELQQNRPVLLSCQVRLPHKPELSWGHEIVGVGHLKLGKTTFIGVLDNYFPTKTPSTIRWLRSSFFDTMILVTKETEQKKTEDIR